MTVPPEYEEHLACVKRRDFAGAAQALWRQVTLCTEESKRAELLQMVANIEAVNLSIQWHSEDAATDLRSMESGNKAALMLLDLDSRNHGAASYLLQFALFSGDRNRVETMLRRIDYIYPSQKEEYPGDEYEQEARNRFLGKFALACIVCGRDAEADEARACMSKDSDMFDLYRSLLEPFGLEPDAI